MSIVKSLLARLSSLRGRSNDEAQEELQPLRMHDLVQAHGDWLALLATILERERVIPGNELARALSEYAAVTAVDHPAQARILSFWAARLQDTAASLEDVPSVH